MFLQNYFTWLVKIFKHSLKNIYGMSQNGVVALRNTYVKNVTVSAPS